MIEPRITGTLRYYALRVNLWFVDIDFQTTN
jgi:hypothetical protein